MRSDSPARAGGSAEHGYRAARGAGFRRRLAQVAFLAAGGVVALRAPAASWALAGILAAVLAAWWVRPDRDASRWRRGAAGERATADLLQRLPHERWVVLHDRSVPGTAANLDHVVVGPTGVWVIDTKSYRARLQPGWRSVRVGNHRVDTGPAAWEASVVSERLGVAARPVLAVHGDGLPARGRRVGRVPVIPAHALVGRLRRRRGSEHLGRSEVAALGAAVAQIFPPVRPRSSLVRRAR